MSNEVATSQDFQQRMFERIRSQIGDLMTDDDLKKIVEAALNKAFFDNRITQTQYGSRSEEAPFIDWMRKLMGEKTQEAFRVWARENEDKLLKMASEHIASTLPAIMLSIVKSISDNNSFAIVEALKQRGLL